MNNQSKDWVCDCCSKLWNELSETRKHLLNAQKELLLAVRATVDMVLEKTEHHHPTNQAQKVTIK